MAPPPEGQHRTLGFPCSVWPRVITGLLLYLAIKPWMNQPGGLRELSPSGLESPDLPLRVCCWPGGTLWPCVQAHTQVCTLQFTTWRPHTVNEIPCSRRGWRRGDDSPDGASERKAGPLFTQLKWKGPPPALQAQLHPHLCPRPMGRPQTHTPHFRTHSGMCAQHTSKSHAHPSQAPSAYRKVTLSNTLGGLKPTHRGRGSRALKPRVHPGSHGWHT